MLKLATRSKRPFRSRIAFGLHGSHSLEIEITMTGALSGRIALRPIAKGSTQRWED
jgi:hypothetical protein